MEDRNRDLVRYPDGDITNPVREGGSDDRHPDPHVQRALDTLAHELDRWQNRQGPAMKTTGPHEGGRFGVALHVMGEDGGA